MSAFIDLAGRRFGNLTVLKIGCKSGVKNRISWLCRCDCGAATSVIGENLRYGHTLSCGCARIESRIVSKTTHGATRGSRRTPEYNTWRSLKDRCCNPKDSGFRYYGGRGIKICMRWASYANFLSDMGKKPTPKHSIDRKNNDGNYCPENCRWATSKQQTRNYRRNRKLTFNERTQSLTEWCEELGLPPKSVHSRIVRFGWTTHEALTTPIRTIA